MSLLTLIFIIIVIALLFGGFKIEDVRGKGVLWIIAAILIVLWLTGNLNIR